MTFISLTINLVLLLPVLVVCVNEDYEKLPDLWMAEIIEGDCFDVYKEYDILKSLVQTVTTRITYGKDVALYKWINGKPILDEQREIAILQSVEETAKNLSVPYWPHLRLFFKDMMEATKLVEYALISDWYYGITNQSAVMKPTMRHVNLNETRKTISLMQVDIIKSFSDIAQLRNSKQCEKLVNQVIGESNCVSRITVKGVQRAFGTFCKLHVYHLQPE